jgi:hypothetical protein
MPDDETMSEDARRVFAAATGLADRYVSALLDPDAQRQKENRS